MFPSPTHQDPRNAPSHRSFLDARGRTDLDPLIVAEGDAHSASKTEPQPPRYTICGFRKETIAGMRRNGRDAQIPDVWATPIGPLGSTRSGPSASTPRISHDAHS